MKYIIKSLYEGQNNGIRIIVAPTGSGKTHAWIEAICDMLSAESNGVNPNQNEEGNSSGTSDERKFIFITPFRKNLPFEQLREMLIERGIMTSEEYDEIAMDLKSNAESVYDNFALVKDEIERRNSMVRRSKLYQSIKNDIDFLKATEKPGCRPSFIDQRKKAWDTFLKDDEPAFRNWITEYFRNSFKTKKARLKVIENDPKWSWLTKLYPSIYLEDKRIIFMSLDKFLSKNSSIVGPNYLIWKNPAITKNACILIDEIDSTKERIFDKIIENSLEGHNLIDLFVTCYNALNKDPKDILDGLRADTESIKGAEKLLGIADKIYTTFRLGKRFTLLDESDSNFIFNAGESHTFSAAGTMTTARIRHLDNRNEIYFHVKEEDGNKNDPTVAMLVDRIAGFKERFKRWLFALVIAYRDQYNDGIENGGSEDRDLIATEDAISTVVSRIFKSSSWQKYFMDELLEMSFPAKAKARPDKDGRSQKFLHAEPISEKNNPLVEERVEYDYDFSTKGFTYYEFENSKKHNEDTYIQMYQCNETPERILIDLSTRAKIIGLSATGDAKTVLKNYDYEYLRKHIGVDSFFPTDEEQDRIKVKAAENRNGYGNTLDDVRIHTEKISGEDAADYNTWLELFDGSKEHTDILFSQLFGSSINDYTQKRYLKIARVFKSFWSNYDRIPLGYVMLNKIPKPYDNALDSNILFEIFNLIMHTCKSHLLSELEPDKSKDYVTILAGEEFNELKDAFFENFLKDDRHKLIITTYITAGAGQNLQYALEKDEFDQLLDVRVIGDGVCRVKDGHLVEVDANMIYLEKPTYIIQNKLSFGDTASFYKALVQISSMRQSGSITEWQFKRLICDAFACRSAALRRKNSYNDEDSGYCASDYGAMYSTPDHYAAVDLVCEQAIGRLCRTKQKRSDIYVLTDADLEIGTCFNQDHEGFTTPEFDAVRNTISTYSPSLEMALTKANDQEIKARRFVNRALGTLLANEESIYNWQMTRKLVIMHPTISEQEYLKLRTWEQNLYIKLPQKGNKYYFHTNDPDGFSDCNISFDKRPEFSEVSAESSKLPEMMQCKDVKRWFEKNGFATEFTPNEYILCPIIFRNIYQGALGEYVGEFILESNHICRLTDVCSDAYEFFDFLADKSQDAAMPTICFDFKNWHESTTMSTKDVVEKIKSKAADYPGGVDAVIIVNLACEGSHTTSQMSRNVSGKKLKILTVPRIIKDGQLDVKNLEQIRTFINQVKEDRYE